MLFLFTTLLILSNPVIEPKTTIASYRNPAKDLRRVVKLVDTNKKSQALSIWKKLSETISPYKELGFLTIMKLPLPLKERKKIFFSSFKFCKEIIKNEKHKKTLGTWLAQESCSTSSRIEVAKLCGDLASPYGRSFIYETIWKSFPGHHHGVEHLQLAISEAIKHKLKSVGRLKRFLIFYHPEKMDKILRTAEIKKLPCPHRKSIINTLLRRGINSIIPEFFSGCQFPLMKARYFYSLGNYKKTIDSLKETPKSDLSKRLIARSLIHTIPPSTSAREHLALFKKDKSIKELKRAIKTFLLSEEYTMVYQILSQEKFKDFYLSWAHGYGAYKSNKPKTAVKLWKKQLVSVWGRRKEQILYWINKGEGKLYKQSFASRNPVRTFYMRNSRLELKKTGTWPSPIPLIYNNARASRYSIRTALSATLKNPQLSIGLSLMEQRLYSMAKECLYDGLTQISKRKRRVAPPLWRCWELAEGLPPKCKKREFPSVKAVIDSQTQSKIAISMNWPHLAPKWGKYLPRPYEIAVLQAAKSNNLPASLLYAIMLSESSFEPYIISPASAVGLFQVIPPTGREISLILGRTDFHPAELLIPRIAIQFGATYLAKLAKTFNRNWPLVVAGYNAGPHQVKRWLKRKRPVDTDEWVEEIPFKETKTYVKLVIGRWTLYARELGEIPPTWPLILTPDKNK
jgi:Transglycosylase SLT domain